MHFEIIVEGRVQGVGYRYYAMTLANKHHIFGTVRNLSNGKVMIIAQAHNQEQIEAFVKDLKIAQHPYMKVTQLFLKTLDLEKNYRDFKIVY